MPDPTSAAVAGIGGGIANIFAASSAAEASRNAAAVASGQVLQQQQQGLQAQGNYFNQGTGALASIADRGGQAYANLENAIPGLTKPIVMNEAALQQTPGYQFNLSQGERGVSLGAAAAGLSGAQAKAAATYATGLADNTYQQQFNNANTNKQNAYNFLLGGAQLGTNAAGQYGALGTSAGNAALSNSAMVGNSLSSNTIGAGNVQGAADIAMGNGAGQILGAFAGTPAKSGNQMGNNPFGNAPTSNNPFGNYSPNATTSMYGH